MAGFFPDQPTRHQHSPHHHSLLYLHRYEFIRMLGLAEYRKNVGNSLVKEHDWDAALLCYLNGLYLLNYAQLAEIKK